MNGRRCRGIFYLCTQNTCIPLTKPLPCLCLLLPCLAAAQSFDDGYYPFAVREEPQPMIETDTALFYRAVQAAEDAYGRITDFNLPQVSLRRRGQEFRDERIELDGIVVSWRHTAALRLLGAAEERTAGIAAESDAPGAAGGGGRLVFPPRGGPPPRPAPGGRARPPPIGPPPGSGP